MAEPSPWQLSARKKTAYKKTYVYQYDPYNFSHVSVSHGTNEAVIIPCDGPHAAGAVTPSSAPQVLAIVLTATGTNQFEMGSNFHQPLA
jgi:hypothetical protein